MYLGKEVEVADVDTIYYGASHPYTQALLRSIPRHDVDIERLETIEGNVPDPTAIPKGCSFHPRCRHYDSTKCGTPPFLQIADNHYVRCTRVYEINDHLTPLQTE
jgi:peptide/nickel transport system ATP-binding protein